MPPEHAPAVGAAGVEAASAHEGNARLLTRSFALAWMATIGLYLAHQLVLPVFPLHVDQIIAHSSAPGYLNGAFMAATGAGTLAIPFLMGRIGRKATLLIGMLLLASLAAYPAFDTTLALLLITVVRGLGFGIGNAALFTAVVDMLPVQRRGEGLGYYQLAVSLGGVIGAGGGVYLWQRLGFSLVILAATAIIALAFLCAAAAPGMLGRLPRGAMPSVFTSLVALPQLRQPTAVFAMLTFSYGGIVTFGGLYVIAGGLGSPAVFFFVMTGAQVVGRPLAGWICDRLPPHVVLASSIGVVVVGLVTLAVATGGVAMVTGGSFFGLGFGAGVIASQMVLMERLRAHQRPLASAMFGVAYSWGMGVGAGVLALAVSWAGYRWLFWIMGAVTSAALVLAIARAHKVVRLHRRPGCV